MKNSRGSIPMCPSPTSSLRGDGSGGKSNSSSKHFSGSKFSLNSQKSDSSEKSAKSVPKPPEEIETIAEKAKFYTSVGLGTTAILSAFAFLFLIPFVVDPAISTIVADYDPVPVTCLVVDVITGEGIKNCSWSSCREGCTSSLIKCTQLYVNYTKVPFSEFYLRYNNTDDVIWDVSYTRYLINSEGCGYPPMTNCTIFNKFHTIENKGKPFACYYSRAYPEVVIGRYSWEDNLKHLILSLIIPNVLFAVSIGVLSYWYCPCCDKACNKSSRIYAEKYPTKEDFEIMQFQAFASAWNEKTKLLCRSDDDDELEY
ncbi:hypothetical protein ACFFRR_011309 [Megaselia abdita]